MAAPHSSSLHTTAASSKLQFWSFTVPHSPLCFTSTLPSQLWLHPSTSPPKLQRDKDTGYRRDFRRPCSSILVKYLKMEYLISEKNPCVQYFLTSVVKIFQPWPTLNPQCAITEHGAGREAPSISQEPIEPAPGTPPRTGLQRLWMLPSL